MQIVGRKQAVTCRGKRCRGCGEDANARADEDVRRPDLDGSADDGSDLVPDGFGVLATHADDQGVAPGRRMPASSRPLVSEAMSALAPGVSAIAIGVPASCSSKSY